MTSELRTLVIVWLIAAALLLLGAAFTRGYRISIQRGFVHDECLSAGWPEYRQGKRISGALYPKYEWFCANAYTTVPFEKRSDK